MRLTLTFGKIAQYSVELANTTDADYRAILDFFIPLIHDSRVKARNAIARAFIFALERAPEENPSDLWHHVLYRIYVAEKGGVMSSQSWVRASGDAFEAVLAERYNACLASAGVRLRPLFSKDDKAAAAERMKIEKRIGSSKMDVLIERRNEAKRRSADNAWDIAGVIHAKTSLAERVSDDIPASRILMDMGYLSILSTLDVKSFPPPHGDLVNRGELGTSHRPSDKRKYIEDHGDFSACFSYNSRTTPSGGKTASGRRVFVCDLRNMPDAFCKFLQEAAR